MALGAGARLGAYEVVVAIGSGGMGEVYRARDTRLDRDVAIKILPEQFAADPDRVARFEREAKALASLNHPHIAAIYGIEEAVPSPGSASGAVRAVVLELVEGPTLQELIADRASGFGLQASGLPVNEALAIARQIADALEAAHDAGIVHRDLKPANVKIRPDGRTYRTIIEQGFHAHYVPTGHIVYLLGGNLMAVPFDAGRLEVTGPAVPVVEGVRGRTTQGEFGFAVSPTGFLVYAPGSVVENAKRMLVWVDRKGREEPLGAPLRSYAYARLSPDGARVALDIRDQENDIWTWDLARQTLTRLTFNPGADGGPVWTPDSLRIVFWSDRGGTSNNLHWVAADGTGQPERLTEGPNAQVPTGVLPDGKRLIFYETDPKTNNDLQMLTLDGDRRAAPLVRTQYSEMNGQVSPDARWLAYQSNESGQDEVYVRPFPNVEGGRWQASTGGGIKPLWARNGRELFYLSGSGSVRLMSVPVQSGTSFSAGTPQVLFEGKYFSGNAGRTYDVSPDGQRFLMIKDAAATTSSAPSQFVVVLNWFEELKRLAPPSKK